MADKADVVYKFDAATKTGMSQLLVVPPGYLYMMTSAYSVFLSWGFGASSVEECAVAKSTLDLLFTSWPALKTGDHRDLHGYLEGRK